MSDATAKAAILPAVGAECREGRSSPLEAEIIELFDQMRERLLRYLRTFRLSAPDGEEVVQETFLALFQHLQRGRSRENLRGWLFRVAHNLALKRLQRERRDPWYQTGAEALPEDRIMDPAPSAEDEISRVQKKARLLAVLKALPEQDRRCLSLRAEGLRYRDIAQVLDMSLGAVALSLERSLARIARAAER